MTAATYERSTSEKEPASDVLIRLKDCDAFAHLHNANFIDYFLEAREDHLRDFYGLDVYEHARKTGVGWLVTSNQIRYFEPVAFHTTVKIVTRLFKYDARELHVEGLMYGAADGRLKALHWTTFRAIDVGTGRPHEHDGLIMNLAASIVYPFEGIGTFDERIASLRPVRRS